MEIMDWDSSRYAFQYGWENDWLLGLIFILSENCLSQLCSDMAYIQYGCRD